ncbi:MAG: ATP-dependent helicase [Anaerolineales bacterium]|nr:ATP-dependent helicase [Anaerolineales bacterium]
MFRPRPHQEQILAYRAGRMGVSAVPGSGKTSTLSLLAADLISGGFIEENQEVLIVTLVNSAVDHFASRVGRFIRSRGLLPNVGYRVRTLHGLAHDIVRERPDLAGVSEGFEIADGLTTERILRAASDRWANEHVGVLDGFLKADLSENDRQKVRRRDWPNLIRTIGDAFIQQAKDLRVSPQDIVEKLEGLPARYPLLEMGVAVYQEYEKALTIRGLLDFNDLIVRALQAIETDPGFLHNLRERWPYILEDEAQDSSRLQERILHCLVGPDGNWVRVGDPNQAIFETFTTASPEFLKEFIRSPSVTSRILPHSGRSTESIIKLANQLIKWAEAEHPVAPLRGALQQPFIRPSPPGDPQPNPPDEPDQVHLMDIAYTAEEELDVVIRSVNKWLQDHPDDTVAVLVPRNERGAQLVEGFRERGVPYVELLRSTEVTRNLARALSEALRHLASPNLPGSLPGAFTTSRWGADRSGAAQAIVVQAAQALRSCLHPEAFVWPRPGEDWLDGLDEGYGENVRNLLTEFRAVLQRWHAAVVLPVDQLLLTISHDLSLGADELALVYKLSLALARIHRSNPGWQLLDLADELERIANNQRRFIGFGELESAFDPERYPGQVIVATMHKAKGLEWDRVYLTAMNNYNFPSMEPDDRFIAERWFTRDGLNLQAEALVQFKALMDGELGFVLKEGQATVDARVEYAAERLRLLFVGVTRAKRELVITWNLGRKDDLKPATPFKMLLDFWEGTDA